MPAGFHKEKMKKVFLLVTLVLLGLDIVCAQEWKNLDWQLKKATHFIIYYNQDVPEKDILEVEKSCEKYYQSVTKKLGLVRFNFWLWERRTKLYIFKDRADYIRYTGSPEWTGGKVLYKEKKIFTYYKDNNFLTHTMLHEIGHIIYRELLRYRKDIPLWLDEGVALYVEDNQARREVFKKILRGGYFLPIASMVTSKVYDLDVDKFYAQSEMLVIYLIDSFGCKKFIEFSKELRDNQNIDEALRKTYRKFKNTKELEEYFFKYLAKEYLKN